MEFKLTAKIFVANEANEFDTHFYGKTAYQKTYEHVISVEYDKREENEVAPSDVNIALTLEDNKLLEVNISKRYFDYKDGDFMAYAEIDNMVFEFEVSFYSHFGYDFKPKISNIIVRQWLDEGSFEDGDDCDMSYSLRNGLVKII